MSQFYRYRPDEIFRRITVTSLVKLMLEQTKLEMQQEDEELVAMAAMQSATDLSRAEAAGEEPPPPEVEAGNDAVAPDQDVEEEEDQGQQDVIESIVFRGKMIRRTASVQSHSKSVADLFHGVGHGSGDDAGNRKASNTSTASSGCSSLATRRSYHHHHHDSSMAASTFMLPGSEDEVLKPMTMNRSVSEGHLLQGSAGSAGSAGSGAEAVAKEKPFLVLDIRPVEDFEVCHIVGAKSYPSVRLTRAVNYETKEMLAFKNKADRVIVVYDYDELQAARFATTLVQRGYDNVFMLSGGLRVALIKFPHRLVAKNLDPESDEKLGESDVLVLEGFLQEAAAAASTGTTRGSGRSSAASGYWSSVSSSYSAATPMMQMMNHSAVSSRSSSPMKANLAKKRMLPAGQQHQQLPFHSTLRSSNNPSLQWRS